MMDMHELARKEGLTEDGGQYDLALPQKWWDDFYQVMGAGPVGIVWYYSKNSVWGEPRGVTEEGKADLIEYTRIVKEGLG